MQTCDQIISYAIIFCGDYMAGFYEVVGISNGKRPRIR
ncbi:MAG: hypothetical protein ACI8P9_003465 [Parasphingorhabdus sp.]|jgi:hypothetical protein